MTINEAVEKFKERFETSTNYPAIMEMLAKLKAEAEKKDTAEEASCEN